MDFVGFLIPAIIGAVIVSAVLTGILKYALELDKEKSQSLFALIAFGIVVISIIGYFIV